MKSTVLITLALMSSSLCQINYIGGNNVDFIQQNPTKITQFMQKLTGSVTEACMNIPGVGSAVLSIK